MATKIAAWRGRGGLWTITAAGAVALVATEAGAQWSFRSLGAPATLDRDRTVSEDGSTRVVSPRDRENRPSPIAVRNGIQNSLQLLPGGRFGEARAVSGDGWVAAGWSHALPGLRAVRWSVETGRVQELGVIPGASVMLPEAVSRDGATIVGFATFLSPVYQPFRWSATGGLEALDTGRYVSAVASGVSANGAVVVGQTFDSPWSSGRATWWGSDNRARDVRDELTGAGLNLGGWRLARINSISPDGMTIAGSGFYNDLPADWQATIPAPGPVAALCVAMTIWVPRRKRVI